MVIFFALRYDLFISEPSRWCKVLLSVDLCLAFIRSSAKRRLVTDMRVELIFSLNSTNNKQISAFPKMSKYQFHFDILNFRRFKGINHRLPPRRDHFEMMWAEHNTHVNVSLCPLVNYDWHFSQFTHSFQTKHSINQDTNNQYFNPKWKTCSSAIMLIII